jgi:hypothetical protein
VSMRRTGCRTSEDDRGFRRSPEPLHFGPLAAVAKFPSYALLLAGAVLRDTGVDREGSMVHIGETRPWGSPSQSTGPGSRAGI